MALGEAGFQTDVTDTAGKSRQASGYSLTLNKFFCFVFILGFLGCALYIDVSFHKDPDILSLAVLRNVLFILTQP